MVGYSFFPILRIFRWDYKVFRIETIMWIRGGELFLRRGLHKLFAQSISSSTMKKQTTFTIFLNFSNYSRENNSYVYICCNTSIVAAISERSGGDSASD